MITTERFALHVLPAGLVHALATGTRYDGELPFDGVPDAFAVDAGVIRRRHEQLLADPGEEPWLLRAVVPHGTRVVVGRIGFHGPPDAEGVVEVGYTVAPEHRRQGVATEALAGLLGWARVQGVSACLASVSPDNAASLATIARLGFVRVGEHIDEEDGLEWVHRLDLAAH